MSATTISFASADSATDKQIDFIATLAGERDWDAIGQDIAARLQATMTNGVSKAKASEIIEWLMKQPRLSQTQAREQEQAAPTDSEIRDGYYAIDKPNDNHKNETVFYRLRTGKRGRWQGFQFIDLHAGPAFHAVRGAGARKEVFEAIKAAGQENARARYGQLLGKCGCCGLPLTDDESRRIGIGPVCRDK